MRPAEAREDGDRIAGTSSLPVRRIVLLSE
jgi:hypothetical protein